MAKKTAKKVGGNLSIKSLLKDIFTLGSREILIGIRQHIQEIVQDVEERFAHAFNNAVKTAILLFMAFVGGIFALVGLSQFVGELLGTGLGYIIVGGGLFLLAIFAKVMQKD